MALKQSPSKGKKANHGRKEFTDIELLPAEPYLDERIKNPHAGVTVLVKKTKTTVNILNNEETGTTVKVTYYVSSIPFDEDYSIRQVRACFQDYWQIEENHSVLDDETLFNQDNVQACNKNTIYNTAVLNKISYPILSYIRRLFSIKAKRTRPISYKATTILIQSMELWEFMEYFCNYWFDKEIK